MEDILIELRREVKLLNSILVQFELINLTDFRDDGAFLVYYDE